MPVLQRFRMLARGIHWPPGVLVGLLCGLGMGLLAASGQLRPFEGALLDIAFRARGPRDASPAVAVVTVDDATVARSQHLYKKGWPLPRRVYASLIDRLREAGARTIVLDVLFSEASSSPADDALLVRACRRAGNVVQAAAFQVALDPRQELPADLLSGAMAPRFAMVDAGAGARRAIWVAAPQPALSATAVAVGHVNVFPEDGGVLRRVPHLLRYRNKVYPSLALAAAASYLDVDAAYLVARPGGVEVGGRHVTLDQQGDALVNWIGANNSYPTYGANLLLDHPSPEIMAGLKDRVVLVGVTALGAFEHRSTPFSTNQPVIEFQANAVDSILSDRALRPVPRSYWLLAMLLLPVLCSWFTARFASQGALAAALTAAGSWQLAVYLLGQDWYLPMEAPLAATGLATAATGMLGFRREWDVNARAEASVVALARGATLMGATLTTAGRDVERLRAIIRATARETLGAREVYVLLAGPDNKVHSESLEPVTVEGPTPSRQPHAGVESPILYRGNQAPHSNGQGAANRVQVRADPVDMSLGSGPGLELGREPASAATAQVVGEPIAEDSAEGAASPGPLVADSHARVLAPSDPNAASSVPSSPLDAVANRAMETGETLIWPPDAAPGRSRSPLRRLRRVREAGASIRSWNIEEEELFRLAEQWARGGRENQGVGLAHMQDRPTLMVAPLPRPRAESPRASGDAQRGRPERHYCGALVVCGRRDGHTFGRRDAALLEALAEQAGLALENWKNSAMLRGRVEMANQDLRAAYGLLAEQSSKLFAAVDSIDAALVVADQHGQAAFVNPASAHILRGATPILGEPVARALAAGDMDELADLFRNLQSSADRPERIRLEVTHGQEVLAAQFTPLLGENDTPLGAMLVVTDISAQRELDRMKTDFVGFVAHELRNPLTTILGYASLMDQNAARLNPAQMREMTTVISRHCRRMNRLITDLLDISRMEAQQTLPLQYQRFELGQLCERMVTEARSQINPRPPLRIQLHRPLHDVMMMADSERLEQVLANLLSNAVKYSPDGGQITVSLEEEGGFVTLEVSDTGMGMTPEQVGNLFGKFYRTPDATARGIKGTGLGLHLVKQLVEAHGGSISVASEPGVGTRFVIVLPNGLHVG